jgi:hypothetical protein
VTFEPLISFSISLDGFNTYGISTCSCSLNSPAISVHRSIKQEARSQTVLFNQGEYKTIFTVYPIILTFAN